MDKSAVKKKLEFLQILFDHTVRYIPKVDGDLLKVQAERIKAEIKSLKGSLKKNGKKNK